MIGQVLSAVIGSLSFAILFSAPRRSYPACALCGGLAWAIYLLGTAQGMGFFIATTLASVSLTLLSRILSVAMKMPTTIFIFSGIFPLVPGAGIYYTAYALIERNLSLFSMRGFQTVGLAVGIALGILIGMGFPASVVTGIGRTLGKLLDKPKCK